MNEDTHKTDHTSVRTSPQLVADLRAFINNEIAPRDADWVQHVNSDLKWQVPSWFEDLKLRARAQGLWNLWLPHDLGGQLTHLEYAPLCELMGAYFWAAEVFNCSPPDTGNMETLLRHGSTHLKDRWASGLLDGTARSAFLMSEPNTASSDPTNLECSYRFHDGAYIINGRKSWAAGAGDPRCKVLLIMARSQTLVDRPHARHTLFIVPANSKGIEIERAHEYFGFTDAPRGNWTVRLHDVKVTTDHVLGEEGNGFKIAQSRLGPGRLHHCMRLIGAAERALHLMCQRAASRKAFGATLSENPSVVEKIARSRIDIDASRLLVLRAAQSLDEGNAKTARLEIAQAKALVATMVSGVVDRAIQLWGAEGLETQQPLAQLFAYARTQRIADGPDEVHLASIGKAELAKHIAQQSTN